MVQNFSHTVSKFRECRVENKLLKQFKNMKEKTSKEAKGNVFSALLKWLKHPSPWIQVTDRFLQIYILDVRKAKKF